MRKSNPLAGKMMEGLKTTKNAALNWLNNELLSILMKPIEAKSSHQQAITQEEESDRESSLNKSYKSMA